MNENTGPLTGVTVVETARFMAGPFAATLLAELGATVIKVEPPPFAPPYFDGTRSTLNFLPVGSDAQTGISEHWVQNGRNKLSLALDYTKPRGKEILMKLLQKADIWIESSRPGTFEKLGFSDEQVLKVNPRLVIVHVSGFGQSGDPQYVKRGAYDLIIQAYSGMMYVNGYAEREPLRINFTICDYVTSVWAAFAAVSALHYAKQTGKGQAVDIAMFEVVHRILDNLAIRYFMFGEVRQRTGNDHPYHFPYEAYKALDGWVVIAAPFPDTWRKFAALIGLNEPMYEDQEKRFQHKESIMRKIEQWLSDKSAKEAEKILLDNGVPASVVYNIKDIAEDPHYKAREVHIEWTDPVAGKVKGVNVVPKFSGTPCRIWRGAPYLGSDNMWVLGDFLGLSNDEIDALKREGLIGEFIPENAVTKNK